MLFAFKIVEFVMNIEMCRDYFMYVFIPTRLCLINEYCVYIICCHFNCLVLSVNKFDIVVASSSCEIELINQIPKYFALLQLYY